MTIKAKRTLIFFATSLIIAFCYLYFFVIPNTDKQLIKDFNEANIAGRIESVEVINHGLITRLKMENKPVFLSFL